MASKQRIARFAVLAALAAVFALPPAVRSQDPAGEVKRKIKSQVSPAYPDLAKRMNIHGKVRLEVTIAADGSVKSVHCLGGHPLLVGASQDAVSKWKFESGPKETTQIIEINFD
jgi:TonB family protein